MSFESISSAGALIPSVFATSVALVQQAADAGLIVLIRAWPGPVKQPITSFGPSWPPQFEAAVNESTPQSYAGRAAAAAAYIVPSLASFLIVAQPRVWFAYSWWYGSSDGVLPCPTAPGTCSAPDAWYPELAHALGPPLGNFSQSGWVYTRSFEHARVVFVADNISASSITWFSPSPSQSLTPSASPTASQSQSPSRTSTQTTSLSASDTASLTHSQSRSTSASSAAMETSSMTQQPSDLVSESSSSSQTSSASAAGLTLFAGDMFGAEAGSKVGLGAPLVAAISVAAFVVLVALGAAALYLRGKLCQLRSPLSERSDRVTQWGLASARRSQMVPRAFNVMNPVKSASV